MVVAFFLFSIGTTSGTSQERPPAAIMMLDPACNFDLLEKMEKGLSYRTPELEDYVGPYEVMCLPGIKSVWFADSITIPLLRLIEPDRIFVLVYDEKKEREVMRYLFFKIGNNLSNRAIAEGLWQGRPMVKGYADIDRGVGLASQDMPYYAKHELAHLWQCGTWHDSNDQPTGKITKHPNAEKYAWCSR